jgi:hypothetical protein
MRPNVTLLPRDSLFVVVRFFQIPSLWLGSDSTGQIWSKVEAIFIVQLHLFTLSDGSLCFDDWRLTANQTRNGTRLKAINSKKISVNLATLDRASLTRIATREWLNRADSVRQVHARASQSWYRTGCEAYVCNVESPYINYIDYNYKQERNSTREHGRLQAKPPSDWPWGRKTTFPTTYLLQRAQTCSLTQADSILGHGKPFVRVLREEGTMKFRKRTFSNPVIVDIFFVPTQALRQGLQQYIYEMRRRH